MILFVAAVGAGLAGGILLLASGLSGAAAPAVDAPPRRWAVVDAIDRVDRRRLALAAGVGLAAAVLVRWPVVVAGSMAVAWIAPLPGQRSARLRAEARAEAIAQWCEMLRDAAGTARGIEGILVATAPSAPEPIHDEIGRFAKRLETQSLGDALDALAGDLAHPIGDLVVTALSVAATAGSRRVASVLGNLASTAHHEASMRRRVEVARARPRSTMRLVAVIVASFVAGLALFARDYLAPYGTPVGQLVLVLIGLYWGLGFWWMARLGHVPETERSLRSGGTERGLVS